MTILRNIIKVTDSLWYKTSCLATLNGRSFGSKADLPSPPKRPLTAYMIFMKENRREILKEYPSLSGPQQVKVLAEKWSHLSDDMKKPYEVTARQYTQLYGQEHKKFYEGLTEEQKEELARLKAQRLQSRRLLRSKKTLREAGLPKAPITSFAFFVQAEAKKKPQVKSASEFIKKVAETWNSLPAESKKAYEIQADQDKVRYMEEMKEWHSKMLLQGDKKVIKAFEELKVKGKGLLPQEQVKQEKEAKKSSNPKN